MHLQKRFGGSWFRLDEGDIWILQVRSHKDTIVYFWSMLNLLFYICFSGRVLWNRLFHWLSWLSRFNCLDRMKWLHRVYSLYGITRFNWHCGLLYLCRNNWLHQLNCLDLWCINCCLYRFRLDLVWFNLRRFLNLCDCCLDWLNGCNNWLYLFNDCIPVCDIWLRWLFSRLDLLKRLRWCHENRLSCDDWLYRLHWYGCLS